MSLRSFVRIAYLLIAIVALPAYAASDCGLAHPFDVLEGWNELAGWTLPGIDGHEYAASYACQGSNRKIVVLQLVERNASGVPFVALGFRSECEAAEGGRSD